MTNKRFSPSPEKLFVLQISRQHVETGNLSNLEALMEVLQGGSPETRQHMTFMFDGFNDVPEEIYEIPAIRDWCARALEQFPYLFYYVDSFQTSRNLAACLGDVAAQTPIHLRKPGSQMTPQELATKLPMLMALPAELSMRIIAETTGYALIQGDTMDAVHEVLRAIPGLNVPGEGAAGEALG